MSEELVTEVTVMTRAEMEQRRLEAAQLLAEGVQQSIVARKFGVSRTTAARWNRDLVRNGDLKARIATGRPCRLSDEQLAMLPEMYILSGCRSGEDLRRLIIEVFGVRYDVDHLYRIMKRLNIRRRHKKERSIVSSEISGHPVYICTLRDLQQAREEIERLNKAAAAAREFISKCAEDGSGGEGLQREAKRILDQMEEK